MALQLIDQTTDLGGHEWHRITQLYAIPEAIKTASDQQMRGGEDTPDHLFADPIGRRYPCHTAAAVVASAAYLYEKAAHLVTRPEIAQIESRILSSANYFNVTDEVSQLKDAIKQAHVYDESALPDDAFALVVPHPNGQDKIRKYPLRNALEVKEAADYFMGYRDDFIFSDRQTIAAKILEKQAKHGASLGEHRDAIEKQAGLGTCPGGVVTDFLQTRIDSLNHTGQQGEWRNGLEGLQKTIAGDPSKVHSPDILCKIAKVVDNIDRECRFVSAYDTMLDRPEDVLFQLTEKIASDVTAELVGSNMTGNFFKKSDLAAVPLESLRAVMGDEFASAISSGNAWVNVEKMAQIVPTLPLGDMQQLETALFEQSIYPIATKTAQDGIGLATETVQQAAQVETADPGSLWNKF